jgi:hypothetical protein
MNDDNQRSAFISVSLAKYKRHDSMNSRDGMRGSKNTNQMTRQSQQKFI